MGATIAFKALDDERAENDKFMARKAEYHDPTTGILIIH